MDDVTRAATSLCQNAQTQVTPDGFVLVCKGDFEALIAALDAPRLEKLRAAAFTPWLPEVSP